MNRTAQMTKFSIIFLTFCTTVFSFGQPVYDSSGNGFTIDTSIRTAVEKMIIPSDFGGVVDKLLIYNNLIIGDFYENDKLKASIKAGDNRSSVFKSFYYWRGDTLNIDGAYGLFGGVGFSIKIINGSATVYHMLASDDFASYTYKENDSLIYRLDVPCTETRTIISEIPDSTKKQIISGYVEFKSRDYYRTSGSAEGKEFLPRIKERADMRIYFKSAILDL
jgi:hypothetical protein